MLRGGIIIASLSGLALVAWGLNKFGRDLDEALAGAFGDVMELPAAAINAGGGRQIRGDGLAQGTLDRTHVGTGK